MRAERLVEQVSNGVTDKGRGGQKKRQGGVFAHHRREGFFLLHRRDAANWAVSETSTPIFGWLGSKSTWMPHSSSASLVVGPMEATSILLNPLSTSGSMPSSAAMRSRCAT